MTRPIIGVTTSYEDASHLEKQHVSQYYLRGVELGGGEPRVLDFLTPLAELPEVVEGLDGVLFIGGWDVEPDLYGELRLPECGPASRIKDLYEIELFRLARKKGLPILAICRGIQVVNVAMGGTLVQDLPSAIGRVHQQEKGDTYWHDVEIVPDTGLFGMMGVSVMATNSYHHQSVKDLAEGLRVTARSRDGVIEAVEGTDGPYLAAVQWHPERTVAKDRYSLRFFQELARAAGAR